MAARRTGWFPSVSVWLGVALVGAAGVRAYVHTASRDATAAWVSHTHEVLETLDGLLIALDDAVAARRGYALGGDGVQLGTYRAAVERVAQEKTRLRQLTDDNPAQQARLDALDPLLAARLAQLESNLRPGAFRGVEAEVTAEGNVQSGAVRQLVASLADEEQRLLAAREAAEQAESVAVRRTLLAGFSLSLAALLLAFLWLRTEMSRRARTEDTLASREQLTSLTLRSIADGVIATDAAGRVVQMNPVAEQLTGWPLAEATGQPFAEVFGALHEKTRAPEPDPVAQVLSTGAPLSLVNHRLLVSRDGTEHPIADSAAPILDAAGRSQGVVLVFRDVSASQASEARFRRLLEAAPDAILITDPAGHITMANQQVQALFGYAPSELCGQKIESLIPERLRTQHGQHRAEYQATPSVRAMGRGLTLFALRKDGSEFPVEVSLSPLQAEEGTSVIAAVRDVSRRHALEQFRDEYLEFISHDLKNPLSVIALQARVLARQLSRRALPEEVHGVEVIAESAAFIDRLVRELLEMAYVESEHLEVHTEAVALGPLLHAVLERTVSSVDRYRVRLQVDGSLTALVEPRRLERVVANFLQNALKYSPAGSPILLRLEKVDGTARVSVVDQGPGLSEEDTSFVFEKYRRTLGAQRKEGLGLGLYICRRIVEAHGGRIGVKSRPGHGASFYFTLPLAPAHVVAARPLAADGPLDPAALAGLRVLLVDDEANAVTALTTLLGEEGLRISGATRGEEALALAASQPFDVAVLDVQMPGMSGLELLKRLRQEHPGLPAIIMTGYMAHHPDIVKLRSATGAAFVGKPVDPDELMRTLHALVPARAG
jgi:PAS domain S-box-containing protein